MGDFRPIKTKCWIKYLEHLGYSFNRVKGSHFQYTMEGKRTIPVRENDKDVPALHLRTSCKSLGINIDDVYDWIEKNC